MREILFKIGGRKFVLLLIALILLALKEPLGIDDDVIAKLILLALGGSATIAAEDALKKFGKGELKRSAK